MCHHMGYCGTSTIQHMRGRLIYFILDLCCFPRASLSDKDKALTTCDDIVEAFLVLPHWKL